MAEWFAKPSLNLMNGGAEIGQFRTHNGGVRAIFLEQVDVVRCH
jgi:hypothetical protein